MSSDASLAGDPHAAPRLPSRHSLRARPVRSGRLASGPGRASLLEEVQPVYEELPGWKEDVSGARRPEDLPGAARDYLRRISEIVDTPIRLVSVGQGRDATIRTA